jgi:hypothetical protein
MKEFAVVWRDTAEPSSLYAGKLAVAPEGLRLRGCAGRHAVERELPWDEIAAVDRLRGDERLGRFPSLRLQLRGGRSLRLASVMGAAMLAEIVDALGPIGHAA